MGIVLAILIAILMYIIMSKRPWATSSKPAVPTVTLPDMPGFRTDGILCCPWPIAGALAAAGASLYYLSGNTEFYWSTYQSLPSTGFNGIPVALLAVNNPIGVIFTGCFMSMLDISGLQLTNLTAYNEYITDVIIATIVYLSAFSLVIKMFISGRKKRKAKASLAAASDSGGAETPPVETKPEKGGEGA